MKRATANTWRASVLGLAMMLATSLLWSVVCVLVLLSVGILHGKGVAKTILILCVAAVPGSVLVGSTLGYWIASAQPSPIRVASIAGVAAVTINTLFVSFVAIQSSTVPHGWADAAAGGAVLGLTAAPFWFIGALVLYGFVERRLLSRTPPGGSRTAVLSEVIRFCLNPAISDTKVANPLTWGCYLLGYNLLLSLLLLLLVVPATKNLGASYIAKPQRFWVWVIFSAVIEELVFRLPLRYTAINVTISALLLTLFPVGILLIRLGGFGSATTTERWLWRAVLAILVASVVFVLLRIEPVRRLVRSIWSDHFRFVVYASCLAFGLVHLLNYRFTSLTVEILLLAPLLVVPQIISGFILAFTRMRLGLVWCIILHAAHNFVLLFPIGPVRPR